MTSLSVAGQRVVVTAGADAPERCAQAFTVVGYMGVASFIGVEALIVLLGFTTVLPIAIPFVLIVLGLAYLFRQRLRDSWHGLRARLRRGEAE